MTPTIRSRGADLKENIERQIVHRTWGRIQRLHVETRDDRVVVHGWTSSYYIKQLALEGALEALGSDEPAEVELDIHVGREPYGRMSHRIN